VAAVAFRTVVLACVMGGAASAAATVGVASTLMVTAGVVPLAGGRVVISAATVYVGQDRSPGNASAMARMANVHTDFEHRSLDRCGVDGPKVSTLHKPTKDGGRICSLLSSRFFLRSLS
jgi:hypothetical protein